MKGERNLPLPLGGACLEIDAAEAREDAVARSSKDRLLMVVNFMLRKRMRCDAPQCG